MIACQGSQPIPVPASLIEELILSLQALGNEDIAIAQKFGKLYAKYKDNSEAIAYQQWWSLLRTSPSYQDAFGAGWASALAHKDKENPDEPPKGVRVNLYSVANNT